MAISVDWVRRNIFIPKADTTLVQAPPPQEIRRLDLNFLRETLKDLEDDAEGMPFLDTHRHVGPISISGTVLARVVEIINGYTVEFEDGQYAVNLVGGNTNLADVALVNQVSIRPNNSAGLQDLSSLQAASYNGWVTIDTVNGQDGTLFPVGTGSSPSSNQPDAQTIASQRGILFFLLHSNLTLVQPFNDIEIAGAGSTFSHTIDFGAQDVNACIFRNLTLTGTIGAGVIQVERCVFASVDNFFGGASDSAIQDVHIEDNGLGVFNQCFNSVNGNVAATLRCGANVQVFLHQYSGPIEFVDLTPGCVASVNLTAGEVTLGPSCTGGTLILRGTGSLVRNDGGAVTVIDDAFISDPDAKLRTKTVLARLAAAPDLYVEPE